MKLRTSFLAALLALVLAPWAFGHHFTYSARLTGAQEVPPNSSPAVGVATITWDMDIITMRVEVTFTGLVGNVTEAHIHAVTAVPGSGTAMVASPLPTLPGFPTGVQAGSYDHTLDMTLASSYNPDFITASGGTVGDALNALFFGMDGGRAYFNIHTTAFADGEIRGFLVVPEPSTLALTGLAALGLGAAARRRAKRAPLPA
jgi:hypothetical protein